MNQVIRSQGAVMEQPGHGQGSRKEYEMVVTMALMKDPHQRHVALASYTEGVVRIFRPEEGRFKNNGFIKVRGHPSPSLTAPLPFHSF